MGGKEEVVSICARPLEQAHYRTSNPSSPLLLFLLAHIIFLPFLLFSSSCCSLAHLEKGGIFFLHLCSFLVTGGGFSAASASASPPSSQTLLSLSLSPDQKYISAVVLQRLRGEKRGEEKEEEEESKKFFSEASGRASEREGGRAGLNS